MNGPLVSVILDNYNYAQYIEEAIQSVLRQTYNNYELIIVDDGSIDASREYIQKYVNQSEKIIPVWKKNGGQMSAFNAAFEKCNGDIIAFLDSDDYWYPNKLLEIVFAHKKYDLVQHYLSNNGKGIYREVNTSIDWHEVLVKYGYLYNHSVCSSLSFRRELLQPFFPMLNEEEMVYCADGILLMLALSLTKVGIVEKELGFYRVHGNNGFVGKSDYGKRSRDILEKQHDYVNKQLHYRGYAEIPFDSHRYLNKIIEDFLMKDKLRKDDVIVVYGTESSGLYLTEVLEERNIEVWGYADSSVAKQGNTFCEKNIYSPQELYQRKKEYNKILIASSAQRAISETLKTIGFIKDKDFLELPI